MTQTELAKLARISQSYLSEIIAEKYPIGKRVAVKLAAVTGRPWKHFIGLTGKAAEAEIRAALEARAGSVARNNPQGVSEHEAA